MTSVALAYPAQHGATTARGAEPRWEEGGSRPRLRVLPIPQTEPDPCSYELPRPQDEPHPGFEQGLLAVDFRASEVDPFFGPQATRSQDLPDPADWSRQMVRVLLETMSGQRPARQLGRWVDRDVLARVERRGVLARQRRERLPAAPAIKTLRVCEPADGIAEVAAVIVHRGRVRALALRLSGVDGRWLITALELG